MRRRFLMIVLLAIVPLASALGLCLIPPLLAGDLPISEMNMTHGDVAGNSRPLLLEEMDDLVGGWYNHHYCRSMFWGYYSQCDTDTTCVQYNASRWYQIGADQYLGCYSEPSVQIKCQWINGYQQCATILWFSDHYCSQGAGYGQRYILIDCDDEEM